MTTGPEHHHARSGHRTGAVESAMGSMLTTAWPPENNAYADSRIVAEVIATASSPQHELWWRRVESVGYCARPIHLLGHRPGATIRAMARCKNRRASVCPSCSALYAADTWHLVHAGITGTPAHDSDSGGGAGHPMVFATLTAPSFGAVHTATKTAGVCHPGRGVGRCRHGQTMQCSTVHRPGDAQVGQPLCVDCYRYDAHVLFAWHAPQLWHRFTIGLRRLIARHLTNAGTAPESVRVSYVKVVELQARAVPHFHAVIRLDAADSPPDDPTPPATAIDTATLAALVVGAAHAVRLDVDDPTGTTSTTLRFGTQIDVQPITTARDTAESGGVAGVSARKLAGYLAKYVTKSVAEFGLRNHRLSPIAIPKLPVTEHVRAILHTVVALAEHPPRADLLRRLHTLGYRGHVTTKTRRYSTTMAALRQRRADWTANHRATTDNDTDSDQPREDCPEPPIPESDPVTAPDYAAARAPVINEDGGDDAIDWQFLSCGHPTDGERLLVLTAASIHRERRHTARSEIDAIAADEIAHAP